MLKLNFRTPRKFSSYKVSRSLGALVFWSSHRQFDFFNFGRTTIMEQTRKIQIEKEKTLAKYQVNQLDLWRQVYGLHSEPPNEHLDPIKLYELDPEDLPFLSCVGLEPNDQELVRLFNQRTKDFLGDLPPSCILTGRFERINDTYADNLEELRDTTPPPTPPLSDGSVSESESEEESDFFEPLPAPKPPLPSVRGFARLRPTQPGERTFFTYHSYRPDTCKKLVKKMSFFR